MVKENLGLRIARRIAKTILILSIIFAIISIALAIINDVKAHGYAEWFMDPKYVTSDGTTHCCGPTDCKHLDEHHATVVEDETGFTVTTEKYTSKMYDEQGGEYDSFVPPMQKRFSKQKDYMKGLYFTEDAENKTTLCIFAGEIKCLAVPRHQKS